MTPEVAAVFDNAPPQARAGMLALRDLICARAQDHPETGGLREELRWGQPSYLTQRPRVGTTIRLGQPRAGGFALFVHCGTTLIRDFTDAFPDMDRIDGNRAVLFQNLDEIEPERHGLLISHALTYHLRR